MPGRVTPLCICSCYLICLEQTTPNIPEDHLQDSGNEPFPSYATHSPSRTDSFLLESFLSLVQTMITAPAMLYCIYLYRPASIICIEAEVVLYTS